METHQKIVDWAKRMGYKKNIPPQVKNLCSNPSTAFLWEQIVSKVQPKQEVDHVRHNIILNRLKNTKKYDRNTLYQAKVKEIELWNKKQKLTTELKEVEENIADNEQKLNNLTKCIDVKSVKCKKDEFEIREIEEKQFLFQQKSKQLKNEIAKADEKLTFFRNVTPVEVGQSSQDVAETLTQCAEKIQGMIEKERTEKTYLTIDNTWSITPEKKHSFFGDSYRKFSKSELSRSRLAQENKCLADKQLLKEISSVLIESNHNVVWSVFMEIFDREQSQLQAVVNQRKFNPTVFQEDWKTEARSHLREVHITNGLLALKFEAQIRKMEVVVNKLQDEIFSKMDALELPSSDIVRLKEFISLQRKNAGIDAKCDSMRRQLEEMQADLTTNTELTITKAKCMAAQQQLVKEIKSLSLKVELFQKIYQAVVLCRQETAVVYGKLSVFTEDLRWALALTDKVHAKEVRVFCDFPLEYNRQLNINNRRVFARNVLRDISLDLGGVDTETIETVATLLQSPHNLLESTFYHLFQCKKKLHTHRALCAESSLSIPSEKYTVEELSAQESYVSEAVERLERILKETRRSSTTYNTVRFKELMDLWIEMPFQEYVPPKRLFNMQPVLHYQKMYDNLYKRL